jgi:hypothetical protein
MDEPKPPDKDSEQYQNLRRGLQRKAEQHFGAPQAAPPGVKQAQEENPELAPPPGDQKLFADGTAPPAKQPKKKRYWIKNPALRVVICVTLLGLTGYCLWYIYQFKRHGETSEIWWPWQKPPASRGPLTNVVQKQTAKATTTATVAAAKTEAKPAAVSGEDKTKADEAKRAQEEAARQAAAEAERKRQELAALEQAATEELRSLAALEASLKGYLERFEYEQASQQMSQLGASLKTEKAKARLQQVWDAHQPFLEFKQTLNANMSAIQYAGKPLANKQGGTFLGVPSHADADKIFFATKYGEVSVGWENVPPDQVAALANYYLKAREQQAPSKALAKDYRNLMLYSLSQKLTAQAKQAGTDAITIDQSLRPEVKAVLGELIP